MKPYWTKSLGIHATTINGHVVNYHVTAYAYFDETFQLDWDFEPGEKERIQKQIESGDLTPSVVCVRAFNGDAETGDDSLSGVLVGGDDTIFEAIASNDMVAQALAYARDNTLRLANKLYKYATTKE